MKKLLAMAAVLAALIVPGYAEVSSKGIAGILLYAENCQDGTDDGTIVKPKHVLFAKNWQIEHPAEVQASRDEFLARVRQAVASSGLTVGDTMPLMCSMMKDMLQH
jgi:hypothetical protein